MEATVLAQDQKPAPKDYVVFPVPPGFVPPKAPNPDRALKLSLGFSTAKGR